MMSIPTASPNVPPRSSFVTVVAWIVIASTLRGQEPHVAGNAPADRPQATDSAHWARMDSAMAPYVAQARASYPGAKQRYLAGLPHDQSLFVTGRLSDDRGYREQVFLAVDSIRDTLVYGRIWSAIVVVHGYRLRQAYAAAESAVLDWLITKPDGTEEGNVVGKFLDTYHP